MAFQGRLKKRAALPVSLYHCMKLCQPGFQIGGTEFSRNASGCFRLFAETWRCFVVSVKTALCSPEFPRQKMTIFRTFPTCAVTRKGVESCFFIRFSGSDQFPPDKSIYYRNEIKLSILIFVVAPKFLKIFCGILRKRIKHPLSANALCVKRFPGGVHLCWYQIPSPGLGFNPAADFGD